MPALCRRLNYRNIELRDDTVGQTVGVVLTSGGSRQLPWLGFISLEDAKRMNGARAVKIEVTRYSDSGFDWIDLGPGEYVQGCLTDRGVYAVTTEAVRVLRTVRGRQGS
jgi:hypothetical protein